MKILGNQLSETKIKYYIKLIIISLLINISLSASIDNKENLTMEEKSKLIVESTDMVEGDYINDKFTPQGANVIPNLTWSNIPDKTKSFALCVEDPDAPKGTFYHWLVINIPSDVTSVGKFNVHGKEITNSWGQTLYKGPSPPGKNSHRYFFKVFALSVEKLNVHDIDSFFKEVNKNLIEEASLMVKYKRHSSH